MRIGAVILPNERWASAAQTWRRAEALGFDHLWTYDHLGWRHYSDGPWFGAVPTLAAAAQVTATAPLGLLVATPNFRHPVAFAREVLALDDISGGRLTLGLGAGDDGYDATVLGPPPLAPAARMERFAEFAEALDGLLTTDDYHYAGKFYVSVGARHLPGPLQRPRPPFVIAANGPRGMRLAARHGAGWATTGPATASQGAWWDGLATLARRFEAALAVAGRAPTAVDRYINLDAAPVPALASVEHFHATIARAAALGYTDVVVRWPAPGEGGGRHAEVLEAIAPAHHAPSAR